MRPFLHLNPVSRLTFSTKQETEINSIHQLVVGATENVKEGNEDIREVMFTSSAITVTRHISRCFLAPAVSPKLTIKTSSCVCLSRQSRTTPASGSGFSSSWSCARSLCFSWTGTTANRAWRLPGLCANCSSGTCSVTAWQH